MAENVGGIYYSVSMDTSQMISAQRDVSRSMGDMERKGVSSLTAIAAAAKLLAVALAAVKSATAADDMRALATRVNVAAGSIERGTEAMRALEAIAKRTGSAVRDNVDVFTRLNQSMLQLGGTQSDTLAITELVGKAIKVSGASAGEASSAILQFGQALGSGKLAGDELRSLLETAPYLMRQLADGMGVPVGALRKLGEEGKLTSDVVVNALSKAATQINADFEQIGGNVASSFTVAMDSAGRLNEKLDTLTGSSAAMTGALKGATTVLDFLVERLIAADDGSSKLGRNGLIQSWADKTAVVLSYVADAAEFVTRGFRQMGTGLGGLAAAAGAAARGELGQARNILGLMVDDINNIGNARYVGERLRQQLAALGNTPAPDRLDLAARAAPGMSQLKPTAGGDGKPGSKKKPFDQVGYLADMRAKVAGEYEKIDIEEAEAVRKNAQRLKDKEISEATHAQAVQLIREAANQQRRELAQNELDDLVKNITDAERLREEDRRNQRQLAEQKSRADMAARQLIADAAEDPVAKIRLEEEAKLAELETWRAQELISLQRFEDAKKAIESQAAKAREEATYAVMQNQVISASNAFSSIADITRNFAGEQNGIYRAMFAASKAFAIAESIIKIQQGIANAAALPFPANIPAMATVAASTANIVSTISGTNYGGARQYGGPVSAGRMYRVNERGAPEMFTAGTGEQFMLPTKSGKVTAADKVGGGDVQWNIVVNNTASGTQASASVDQQSRTVTIAVQEVASQIRSNTGPVWGALRGSTNVQGRM